MPGHTLLTTAAMDEGVAVAECPVDPDACGWCIGTIAVGDLLHRGVDERLRGIAVEGQNQRAVCVGQRADGGAVYGQCAVGQGGERAGAPG